MPTTPNTKDDIKYKTAQAESQEDSTFPAEDNQVILNKTGEQWQLE